MTQNFEKLKIKCKKSTVKKKDFYVDVEKQKLAEIEKLCYGRDLDQLQKELQQLEVRRVHIKQNAEELRRQDFDVQLAAVRQNCVSTTSEYRSTKEKTAVLDREIVAKQNVAEKLSSELNKDWNSEFDDDVDLRDFDAKLIEFEEKIRDKKKLIDNLEAAVIKENSLELLTTSLSTLKQLQVEKQMDAAEFVQKDKQQPSLPPLIKETTPGVWV